MKHLKTSRTISSLWSTFFPLSFSCLALKDLYYSLLIIKILHAQNIHRHQERTTNQIGTKSLWSHWPGTVLPPAPGLKLFKYIYILYLFCALCLFKLLQIFSYDTECGPSISVSMAHIGPLSEHASTYFRLWCGPVFFLCYYKLGCHKHPTI